MAGRLWWSGFGQWGWEGRPGSGREGGGKGKESSELEVEFKMTLPLYEWYSFPQIFKRGQKALDLT